jgi:K(+)-stimulated pyrophosphate-energized sodium pump
MSNLADSSGRTVADWAAFRPLWWTVAIALILLLLLLWLMGYGPDRAGCCAANTDAAAAVAPAVIPPAASPPATSPPTIPPVDSPTAPAAPATPLAQTPKAPVAAAVPTDVPPAAKIYFARDKIDLPGDTSQTLAEVQTYLQIHPQSRALISGFHDPSGSTARNKWLANNRARVVQVALTTAGLPKNRLRIAQPKVTTGTGPPQEARRVEVSVQP